METDYARNAIAATLLIAFGVAFAWGQISSPTPAPTYRVAAPVATLMPTPRIHIPVLPTPAPAPVVYAESGASVTISTSNVNVRVCVLAVCP